jgi:glyoxylate reductase
MAKPRPRVLVTRRLTADVEARLARDFDATLNAGDVPMTREEMLQQAQTNDALLVNSIDKFGRDFAVHLPPSIRIVATASVGYDHIDIAAAKVRGIAVTNTPDVLTEATADIALLLILGAARGASWGDRMVRENRWETPSFVSPLGFDVSGRRLGILGMGRIGQAVARRATGFGMELHYHSRSRVAGPNEHGARYHARFTDILPFCDFLSINCASTPETRGIINDTAIALLPADAITALGNGKLAAAGLDVFRNEPNIDPRYRELQNVFLLPHLGSATPRTRSAMGMRAVDNLEAFFRGERPRDLLTGA